MVDDRRTRHTKERIHNAMITCLISTSLDNITVVQICKTAGINRSTFYAHYPDTISLYKLLEQKTTDDLTEYFQGIKDKTLTYVDIIRFFLDGCYNNKDLFLALYNTDSRSFKQAFLDILEGYDFIASTVPHKDRTYIFEYYINGIFSVVAKWLLEDTYKSVADMTKLVCRLTHLKA